MSDCIFCKIINKEIPAEIVYENENTLAFLDINPINKGHTLVIPKEHFENLFEISEDSLKETMIIVKKVATVIDGMSQGVNIGQNNRLIAGQIVKHIHFHVIPRYENDGLKHWPGKIYNPEESKSLANQIKKSLE